MSYLNGHVGAGISAESPASFPPAVLSTLPLDVDRAPAAGTKPPAAPKPNAGQVL